MLDETSSDSLAVRRFDVRRVNNGKAVRVVDGVAVEEPLGIRIAYRFKERRQTMDLAVTMRTPGHDRELAAGFLLTEGVVQKSTDILSLVHIGSADPNEIMAELAPEVDMDTWRLARNSFVGASCGICGKQSRAAIASRLPELPTQSVRFGFDALQTFPALLQSAQAGFTQTGGLHAAALITSNCQLAATFEDIGRHNALDKLIGHCLLNGLTPLHSSAVFLSSRSSFELIQKASSAGVTFLATVGGSSSLAVEAARDCGMTLIGFVRPGRCNIYSGEWRLTSD